MFGRLLFSFGASTRTGVLVVMLSKGCRSFRVITGTFQAFAVCSLIVIENRRTETIAVRTPAKQAPRVTTTTTCPIEKWTGCCLDLLLSFGSLSRNGDELDKSSMLYWFLSLRTMLGGVRRRGNVLVNSVDMTVMLARNSSKGHEILNR